MKRSCPLLDYEVNVDTQGSGFYSCCWTTDCSFDTLDKLRDWQQEQKQTFRENKWPTACKVCRVSEKNTGQSLRTKMLNEEEDYNPDTAVPKIKYSNISYKNLCNYACIICNPGSSTAIYDLIKESGLQPDHWSNNSVKSTNLDNSAALREYEKHIGSLERVTLLGGEPFLIKEYIDFLRKLSVNCRVLVNTNASVYNQKLVDELKRFEHVSIGYSIDAYGEINEAVRLNSSWSTVERNVQKLKQQLPDANHYINPVITKFNVLHWEKLYLWAVQHGLYSNAFWQNVITNPEAQKLCYIPQEWHAEILDSLRKYNFQHWLQEYFNETPTINIKEVQSEDIILKNIAKSKNIDYIELFPHIFQERI